MSRGGQIRMSLDTPARICLRGRLLGSLHSGLSLVEVSGVEPAERLQGMPVARYTSPYTLGLAPRCGLSREVPTRR